uniref:Uncharacterized protein n=1 Tax=Caudovirales sp. ctqPn17 TaxID=2825772 RepID=A0A8S5QFS1_9CAUD|nr:MAG TPA: hypothetical protein [Caudovirales sp. ctqPn17]
MRSIAACATTCTHNAQHTRTRDHAHAPRASRTQPL